MCRDNRTRFRKLWGKPSFCWKGSEFYFHCWVLRLGEKGIVLVLTAKGKGTCYEAVTQMPGGELPGVDIRAIIRFLKEVVGRREGVETS